MLAVSDGEQRLREWALRSEEFTSGPDHYRFSFIRDIGRVRLVMIDSRNGRVLEPGKRRLVDTEEWEWISDACRSADVDHLLIGTSLPVFVPIGLHDLQVWSERICDGAWGRLGVRFGEWLRVKADMEDWASFSRSFHDVAALLGEIAHASDGRPGPATISVLSGDIHFSYAAEIRYPGARPSASRVHQLVSSPIRNALRGPEKAAMRLGTSVIARSIGRALRRLVGRRRPDMSWQIDLGPVFANCVSQLSFDGRAANLLVLQSRPHDDEVRPSFDEVIEFDLVAGSRYGACNRRRVKVARQKSAIGGEADADNEHHDDPPRRRGESAQGTVEPGRLGGVIGDRSTQQKETNQADADAAADLADGSQSLGPVQSRLVTCPTDRARH